MPEMSPFKYDIKEVTSCIEIALFRVWKITAHTSKYHGMSIIYFKKSFVLESASVQTSKSFDSW